jgi:hypothetical protein
LVEIPAASGFGLPHLSPVLDLPSAGAVVSQAWVEVEKQLCCAWVLVVDPDIGTPQQMDSRRKLRIHLLRLHAERECLRLLLKEVGDGGHIDLSNDTRRRDAIQLYQHDAIKSIEQPERFGHAQSPLLDAARMAFGVALQGRAASLLAVRKKVTARIQQYVDRENSRANVIYNIQGDYMNTNISLGSVTVTGDFNIVTAKNIKNSFNKAAAPDVDAEMKEKLQRLAVEVANLAKALPPEEAEHASKDLECLTSEATSTKPRKEWYELSAKGLLDAAKTVAAMVSPVTTAVKAVLALLA